jgi:uncharacterized protein Yka (UPF0111/DUF47 family)
VLFEKLSDKLLEVADILDKIIVNFSDKKELSKKFSELEHSADEVAHQLIEKINKTFITPFDRGRHTFTKCCSFRWIDI